MKKNIIGRISPKSQKNKLVGKFAGTKINISNISLCETVKEGNCVGTATKVEEELGKSTFDKGWMCTIYRN